MSWWTRLLIHWGFIIRESSNGGPGHRPRGAVAPRHLGARDETPQAQSVLSKPPPVLTTPGVDQNAIAHAFIDLLLENEYGSHAEPNASECFIIAQLERLLEHGIPDSAVPQLPEVAATLMRELADPNISQERILQHLKRDPAIASEVLKLANSPLFRASEQRVENLDRALLLLGLNTLKSIVSSVLMKPMLEIRPIYFRLFGQDLWQHSLDCAQACQNLAKFYGRVDPFNAYLVGLMHDIGKLAIFRLLIESFRQISPNVHPRGFVFADIVRTRSPELTLSIAKHWSLSEYLLTALSEQLPSHPSHELSSYGFILRQANMLAEFRLVAERSPHKGEGLETLKQKYAIPGHLYETAFPSASSGHPPS